MSRRQKNRKVAGAAATSAASVASAASPNAPSGAATVDSTSTPAGRTGPVVVAAALAIAVIGWGIARTPTAVSTAQAGPPPEAVQALPGFRSDAWYLPDDELLGFVQVPEGLFLMGSDPADTLAFDNEHWVDGTGPASVQVATFYIGRFEVTVAQLRAFLDATGYRASPEAARGPADHPAVSMSWTDALAYARWLEEEMKASASTPPRVAQLLREGWHVTLPTEAQWEKAARGTDGRTYPWGNELRTDRANFQSGGTSPVGSFACPDCPYGLADMSGNAWEWTRTPFRDGPYDPSDPRVDLERDALWVMRGGSYSDPARNVRAALRGGGDPGVRRPFIGFRLVLSR